MLQSLWRIVGSGLVLLLAGAAAQGAAPAPAPGVVITVLEGDGVLLRGAVASRLQEGQRLLPGDIVEPAAGGGFVRCEWASGLMVDLAGGSRAMIDPALSAHGRARGSVYLLVGLAKLSLREGAKSTAPPLASRTLDVAELRGDAVLSLSGAAAAAFAERGDAVLLDRADVRHPARVALRPGDFYQRSADEPGATSRAPSADFIARLPRAFRDRLPSRLETVLARPEPAPQALPARRYEELSAWLGAEPALRGGFVTRFRPLAQQQPEFRRQLDAHLADHPEWDRWLHPEKYVVRPASVPRAPVLLPASAGGDR